MSTYSNAYTQVIARTVDIMFCGWFFRTYDVTISTMAGLELRKTTPRLWAKILGGLLNWIQAGHCELAILADTTRLQEAAILLGVRL